MPETIRIGIIGFDTSHVPAFARLLNDVHDPHHVPGGRVVAGYPSFSPDLQPSYSRVQGFVADVEQPYGVSLVTSVEALVDQTDAIILASGDGRRHLAEARPVIAARKPLYIDKPLAHNYADAAEIARLAAHAGCPIFSASSLRFDANIVALKSDPALGEIVGCDAYSPGAREISNPGLFWYGVHAVEILYTFMGPGCEGVQALHTDDVDFVVGRWSGGRCGTVRASRTGAHSYGATVFGAGKIASTQYSTTVPIYAQLLHQIVSFFAGGPAPVPLAETVEQMAFMQAALASEQQGREIRLDKVRV